jgi:hypothetical protein
MRRRVFVISERLYFARQARMPLRSPIGRGSFPARATQRRPVGSRSASPPLAAPASARAPPQRSASAAVMMEMRPWTAAARPGNSPQICSAQRCSSDGKPSPALRATVTINRATSRGFSGRELQHPAPDRFVGDVEPALGKQILDVSVAERKAQVEPDRMPDDNRRKPVTTV